MPMPTHVDMQLPTFMRLLLMGLEVLCGVLMLRSLVRWVSRYVGKSVSHESVSVVPGMGAGNRWWRIVMSTWIDWFIDG